MLTSYSSVRVTDVLDPITSTRSDVVFDVPGPARDNGPSVLDGSTLWVLPGLYDADAHLPVLQRGLREADRWRALAGGATAVNTAVPWHLLEPLHLAEVTAFFAATEFPRVLPILSVADEPTSAGFAAWIDKFGAQVRETWMPTIKLYSNDPHFWPNLEAIWAAECRAAVYFYDEQALADVVASRGGPVHFRHVTSESMYREIASRPDSTCQTSPHFLVELPAGRTEELFVLPPVPGEPALSSLRGIIGSGVDVIASDHNAPVLGNTGPGLEVEQFLLPALLQLVADGVLELPTALDKAGDAAVRTFRPEAQMPAARILVDPAPSGPIGLWPGQESRRAAFRDVELQGTVVAALSGEQGVFL